MIPGKKQINNILKLSKNEYIKFKKTKNIGHLQQAGNKLYKALGMIVENIQRKDIKTNKGVEMNINTLINSNILNQNEVDNIASLHSFFYQGEGENIRWSRMYLRGFSYLNKLKRLIK